MKEKIIDHFKNDSNIVSIAENGDTLFITVKDSGLIDLEAIEALKM